MKDFVCFRSTADTTGHEQWLMHWVDCKWHGNEAKTYRQSGGYFAKNRQLDYDIKYGGNCLVIILRVTIIDKLHSTISSITVYMIDCSY